MSELKARSKKQETKMSRERWKAMHRTERIDYLNSHDMIIESRKALDGSKKVGDCSAVSRQYRAFLGGVAASRWLTSEQEARKEASKNLREINKINQ